ncbi:flagellar motor protein MotA [Novimethylophilus kurashikiensis]|uniref:Flagellar motor protein MotA n=1 Tax=Novimethylophilus kurashikiensis TaxID=1825523 RepID=A0A2R5F957_9PROT|nr:PilZ domain-containing protein [Novimethylophilus kurashikiensis]GBG13164.1 flagellar motor protein MotA [Novimethylophilus kurashikiensis]
MAEQSMTDGISFEATLPLGWVAEDVVSQAQAEMRSNTNAALLRALASLEVQSAEHEGDKQDVLQKALERVESKLDLVLVMLAGGVQGSSLMPAEKPVTLYPHAARWMESSATLPQPGQRILLSIYLSARLPQPLLLSAEVKTVETGNEKNVVTVIFSALDEVSEEWLTRTIFRYHRRALQARRQP